MTTESTVTLPDVKKIETPRMSTYVDAPSGPSDETDSSLGQVWSFEPWTEVVSRARIKSDGPVPTDVANEVRSVRPNTVELGVFSSRVKSKDVRSVKLTMERPSANVKLPVPVEMSPALSGPPRPE